MRRSGCSSTPPYLSIAVLSFGGDGGATGGCAAAFATGDRTCTSHLCRNGKLSPFQLYLTGLFCIRELNLDAVQVIQAHILTHHFRFAVPKGNQALLEDLDAGIAIIEQSGELDRIRDRWLSPLERSGLPIGKVAMWIALILTPFVLLTLAALLWSYMLRKEVAERTATLEQEIQHRRNSWTRVVKISQVWTGSKNSCRRIPATPSATAI